MASRAAVTTRPSKRRALAKSNSPVIVLVDDDSLLRRALGRLLQEHRLSVISFERPSEVLLSCLPATNAILILDIYMPEMTGVALFRELKARGFNAPVILITGRRDALAATYAKQIEAVAVLYKPIEEKDLLEAIGQAVGRSID